MPFFSKNIGIDLGTANTRIYTEEDGIVLDEASALAYDTRHKKIVAFGNDAEGMLGRTPSFIEVIYPLKEGVIADYHMAEAMLRCFLERIVRIHGVFSPKVVIGVPAEATEVEKRAVEDAVLSCGARQVTVIDEPIASGMGLGLEVKSGEAHMIVDIGAGTTEAAVISLMGIATGGSIRTAGDAMDSAIINYIKKNYSLLIGTPTARMIKENLGSATAYEGEGQMDFKGRDLLTGLPKTISVTSEQIREALTDYVVAILECIRRVLEKTPPELIGDITANGIHLVGGGSFLKGLSEYITSQTGLKTSVAQSADTCLAEGIGRIIAEPGALKNFKVTVKKNK